MSTISTIAAIATSPGPAALAIVRLSGPDARAIVRRLVPKGVHRRLDRAEPRIFASFHHPITGERIDEGIVQVFVAPRSFTGEDVVELQGHGGRIAPERVLAAALAAGAAPAAPGEFTRRALLNGKLDLLQAEALLDLIQARSEGLERQAVYQLAGSLSRLVEGLRRGLIEALARLEVQIDFPEDEIGLAPDVAGRVRRVRERVVELLSTYAAGGVLRDGVRVVIAGLPNVGKSSLFNCLLGEERSIVTRHPGTTRDAVEAEIGCGGVILRLVDTAGVREAQDEIEALGVELSRRQMAQAQVVLLVVEGTRRMVDEERDLLRQLRARPHVVALSKCDLDDSLNDREGLDTILREGEGLPKEGIEDGQVESAAIETSAITGQGREELLEALLRKAVDGIEFAREAPTLTRLRQKAMLDRCLESLDRGLAVLEHPESAVECAAADLREASDALEELLGRVTNEDVLDEIFGSFCIGK